MRLQQLLADHSTSGLPTLGTDLGDDHLGSCVQAKVYVPVQSPLTTGKAGGVVTEAGQSLEVAWCVLLWTGEEGLSWN